MAGSVTDRSSEAAWCSRAHRLASGLAVYIIVQLLPRGRAAGETRMYPPRQTLFRRLRVRLTLQVRNPSARVVVLTTDLRTWVKQADNAMVSVCALRLLSLLQN